MSKILIVYHTQSGNTAELAKAVKQGAADAGAQVVLRKAADATLRDLLSCDGYCFGTPDYFSYMAGALKDFFDRTCYPSEGKIDGRPYACFVSHGGGGEAVKSLLRMCKRFKLRLAAKPLLIEGKPSKPALAKAQALGRRLSEELE